MPDNSVPGHFRIGFETLQIPPVDISTNKINNDDQVSTLRTTTSMFVKTGQARWDVTVRWKAVRKGDDISQWEQLRNIVAMFRVAPFVEVENDYLRQLFTNVQVGYKTQRMAFAMKQIRIDTDPNTTNVLDITLTMTLFNFSPFSTDFGYVDATGASTDATNSPTFKSFINNWVISNMDTHPGVGKSTPPIVPWIAQEDGTVTFKWRRYISVPFTPNPANPANASSAGYSIPAAPSIKLGAKMKALPENVQVLISQIAPTYQLDPNIVAALCFAESTGNVNAGASNIGISGVGLMQLTLTTASGLGLGITRNNILDPALNVAGGCKNLADMYKIFGNYPQALAAYNVGPAIVKSYRDGTITTNNPQGIKSPDGLPPAGLPFAHPQNTPSYVHTILINAGKSALLPVVVPQSTTNKPPATPNDTLDLSNVDASYIQLVTNAFSTLPEGTWYLDHYTSYGVFFFEENSIILPNYESILENQLGMYPTQISLVMVNNLPQIPLAGMQYPTYQHVGPCDTMTSISFLSVGGDDGNISEPEHLGIEAVAGMAATLDTQYHELKNTWRAVSSIHRMQAIFVENQILNMLGIAGVMLRSINTESIPESANHMQVSMMVSQYENIFEEVAPFRINGIAKAYTPVVKNMLVSGALDKLSTQEQQAFAAVKEFGDKWQSRDKAYLLDQLLQLNTTSSLNPLGTLADSNATPDTGIWNTDRDILFKTTDQSIGVTVRGDTQGAFYPGLVTRRSQLQGTSKEIQYADYFVFSQLPSPVNASQIQTIRARIEPMFASQIDTILDAMYQCIYNYKLQIDPVFIRQLSGITNSPTFRDIFLSTANSSGPMTDPFNATHTCYKDLGLTDYRQGPTDYFVDYDLDLQNNVNKNLGIAMGAAQTAASTTNAAAGINTGAFQFSDTGQSFPGGAAAVTRMTNIPAYSMSTAFPTFKLMLMEEDNTGPFFAFDNFYSYATVIDIEVIRYADKPDAAIIQITNLAHLLQHRFYDDTASGKVEQHEDRFNNVPDAAVLGGPGTTSSDVATGGSPTSGVAAGRTLAGIPYQIYPRKNMTDGVGDSTSRAPLRFYALQTGSKIQVRLGYSNNPDELYPVFTGQVTEIEGDEILTITCQGFMLELMNTPGTSVISNSHWGFNVFSGGAAFGDMQWSQSGDTGSVMTKFIQAEPARHFGHWQIGGLKDPLTKGFQWTDLAAPLAGAAGFAKVGALLQTGNDRSAENILINSIINFDATVDKSDAANKSRRLFDDESPLIFGRTKYSVPQSSPLSVWELIKDVSRRLPHYNLVVKDYGFPYAADATLVFANPSDWFYYRPPLFGEAEKEKIANASHGPQFQTWWSTIGKAKFEEALTQSENDLARALPGGGLVKLISPTTSSQGIFSSLIQDAGTSPESFTNVLAQLHELASGTISDTSGVVESIAAFFANLGTKVLSTTLGGLTSGAIQDIDRNLQEVSREWLRYLAQSDPASNSSRIKPVRKYHFVDYNHIIHNGIAINDTMYNAVMMEAKGGNKVFALNQNIPPQHLRVLNVHELMNDPEQNVYEHESMKTAYAQSFIREEAGKMYRGELIIRGVPEIEPMDIVMIMDTSTGTIGPIEVESVIHSFSLEGGYITIIKPRLMLVVNESASNNIVRALGFAFSNGWGELLGLKEALLAPGINVPGAVGLNAARAGAIGGGVVGTAAIAAGIVWAPPLSIVVGALALLSGFGLLQWKDHTTNVQNLFKLMPLSRFGRPWLGGLQGFQISDFYYSLNQKFTQFVADEISPTIESWESLMNYQTDYLPTQQ